MRVFLWFIGGIQMIKASNKQVYILKLKRNRSARRGFIPFDRFCPLESSFLHANKQSNSTLEVQKYVKKLIFHLISSKIYKIFPLALHIGCIHILSSLLKISTNFLLKWFGWKRWHNDLNLSHVVLSKFFPSICSGHSNMAILFCKNKGRKPEPLQKFWPISNYSMEDEAKCHQSNK